MRKLLVLLMIGLFLSPMLVGAISEPQEGDPEYSFDRIVEHQNRAIIEIGFDQEGDGIYLAFECNSTLNMHIINSSARLEIMTEPIPIWDPVLDINLLYRTEGNVKFILPYNDTFYILFVNSAFVDSDLIGWYALDKTGPQMEVFGIEDGQNYDYTDEIDVICSFEEIYWNITKLELLYGVGYIAEEQDVSTKFINWSVQIDFSDYREDAVEFIFRGTDVFENTRDITINIVIINRPTTPVEPTEPPIGIFILMFGLFGICGIVAGLNHIRAYRKEGMDAFKPKVAGKKRKKKRR